jgi:glycerol-3-phosphate acyltransferase
MLGSFLLPFEPCPGYAIEFLDIVGGMPARAADGLKSKVEVANFLESELGKALGFACTKLTRKDKYFFLTSN